MRRLAQALLLAALMAAATVGHAAGPLTVGSKKFTESVVLGEIARGLLRDAGLAVRHEAELGGSRLLFDALRAGEIDAYPEYTGTLRQELLSGEPLEGSGALEAALRERGLAMTPPLGFDNSYALGMRRAQARRLGIQRISQLRGYPDLRLGFSNEFLDRADGWPGLQRVYDLPHEGVRGLDHDLAYRALAAGRIAVTDVYTTDAEIAYHDLRVLRDDRGFFPRYEAVFLYRAELGRTAPGAVAALNRLAGPIDRATMRRLNGEVKLAGRGEPGVAAGFLREAFGIRVSGREPTRLERIATRTGEHLALVGVSLAVAVVVAIPLGIQAARRRWLAQLILGLTGIVLTIPALALLVFMMPLFGIGYAPAVAALFLYSLLPVVRNTHAGLQSVAPELRESAQALGLTRGQRLRHVELPLAAPAVLAGIKTAAVMNVGFATLGALIGAGGYGQPILTGIRLNSYDRILEGAVPAALLAVAAHLALDAVERVVVSRGLRRPRLS